MTMVVDPNGKKHPVEMWLDAYELAGEIDGWYEATTIPGRAAFIQRGRVVCLIDSHETGGYDYRGVEFRIDRSLTKEKFDRLLKLAAFE